MHSSEDTATWAEVTSLAHGHGGTGWEIGTCLWSPSASKDGAKRYGVMHLPRPGDHVFHLVSGVSDRAPRQRVLFGRSLVKQPLRIVAQEPPSPGEWANAGEYFRIDLAGFSEFPQKHSMDELEAGMSELILADLLNRPKYFPYAPYRDGFRGAQGIYLTRLSTPLAAALEEVVAVAGVETPAGTSPRSIVEEFAEGERGHRESTFFKRHPGLRDAAIQRHGAKCQVCGFDFERTYGDLGAGFIEVHHLNPLAERHDSVLLGQQSVTNIDDVIPLCANCHRVVHRRRPALAIEVLRAGLRPLS